MQLAHKENILRKKFIFELKIIKKNTINKLEPRPVVDGLLDVQRQYLFL